MKDNNLIFFDPTQAASYTIIIYGHLSDLWKNRFQEFTITREKNGSTKLKGIIKDQAALHGIFKKIRDSGLAIISINAELSQKQ